MSATLVELADKVAADLNLQATMDELGAVYEALRVYTSSMDIKEAVQGLKVRVFPGSMLTSNGTRNSSIKQPVVMVGFTAKPASSFTNENIDELMQTMEAAGDHFRRTPFTMENSDVVRCVQADVPQPYDYDRLKDDGLFLSYLVLTFRRED